MDRETAPGARRLSAVRAGVDDALTAQETVLSADVRAQIVGLPVQARRLDAKRLRLSTATSPAQRDWTDSS